MAKEDRKYVIIPLAEVEDVDFSQVEETDSTSLRFCENAEYTFVKFQGNTPSFLEGKTQYTYSEFLEILNDENGIWDLSEAEEEGLFTKLQNVIDKISWDKYNPFNWFS